MVSDAIISKHFGRLDPKSLSADEYGRGVASLLNEIANATQDESRLELWLAARTIGIAPPADATFTDPAIRARAISIEEADL